MKLILPLLIVTITVTSCSGPDTIQIGENTFVHKSKVYRIVDNELTVLGALNSDSIRQFQVLTPTKRDFGKSNLSFVKTDAYSQMDALFRGNTLYFNFYLLGLNDLKENYDRGHFIIQFEDEFGFIIHSIEVSTSDLTRNLDSDNSTILSYSYNGKNEMSSDIYKAIKKYSVSSTVKARTRGSFWNF